MASFQRGENAQVFSWDVLKYHSNSGLFISGGWNRGVLISGCWNRGVPLYTEVSSFQEVGFPLYTEVSSIQGVGIEGFHCIQRCPHFRVLE